LSLPGLASSSRQRKLTVCATRYLIMRVGRVLVAQTVSLRGQGQALPLQSIRATPDESTVKCALLDEVVNAVLGLPFVLKAD